MIEGPFGLLVVLVLAAFVGYEVISKVPSVLHTPLMSGSNAIHGVILVGAMIVAGNAAGALQETLSVLAVILATLNVVGGFAVTDRMLGMFSSGKPREPVSSSAGSPAANEPDRAGDDGGRGAGGGPGAGGGAGR